MILALTLFVPISSADKMQYVIFLEGGKIVEYQQVTAKYLTKFGNDPSCPAQRPGAIIVDSLEGYEFVEPVLPLTEKEKFLKMLDDTDIVNKIKDKVKP